MTPRANQRRDRLHRWVWALLHAAIWFVAICCATWLRFDFNVTRAFGTITILFAVAAMGGHFLIGPYAVGHQQVSFEQSTDIGRTVAVTTGGLLVCDLIADPIVVARNPSARSWRSALLRPK